MTRFYLGLILLGLVFAFDGASSGVESSSLSFPQKI
jgi:hypothetical protein